MAFFPQQKLQPRRIEIDHSGVSSQSPEVQDRLQRIDDNYQAFDELFADVQATIESDERLREFNAHLKVADLQPKKKGRWRSRSANPAAAKKRTNNKASARATSVAKAKDAQLNIPNHNKKTQAQSQTTPNSLLGKKRVNKPR